MHSLAIANSDAQLPCRNIVERCTRPLYARSVASIALCQRVILLWLRPFGSSSPEHVAHLCSEHSTLAFDALEPHAQHADRAARRGLFWTSLLIIRNPRNMCIAATDVCSSHDLFGTYRKTCTGPPYVRLHGTWYRCGSDTRSCCESVQTRRIPCNTLGIPCIPPHVRQSHSKCTPCFDLNFPFLSFAYAAAVTDPADGLPAVFRDPADGLSAAFLRPRC